MAYVVLHTVLAGGAHITHLPTSDRITGEHDTYRDALTAARALRTGGGYALAVARGDLPLYEPPA